MQRYGQSLLAWGTLAAPNLFTGTCRSFSYEDAFQRYLDKDVSGDPRALVQHGAKAEVNFEAEITDASESAADFLDLSGVIAGGTSGNAISVAGITAAASGSTLGVAPTIGGVLLARRVVETWRANQPKTASVQAVHYPNMSASGALSAATIQGFNTGAAPGMYPSAKLVWGTSGVTMAAGILHGLTLTQEVQIVEDDEDPAGTYLGVTVNGYMREIEADILAKSGQTAPAKGAVLTFTAPPDSTGRFADYRIEKARQMFANEKGVIWTVNALWISPFGDS